MVHGAGSLVVPIGVHCDLVQPGNNQWKGVWHVYINTISSNLHY